MTFLAKVFYCNNMENELKSYHNKTKLSKFCIGAGFLNVVEIGQYFVTKDTEEFSQLTDSVACREYTLPRDEEASEPKDWIRGNTKIGPVLEVATCCLQGKYGVEIRIMSMNEDSSHSWVRISHGSNKLVTNLNNSEQEASEVQFEEYALRLNASDFASRSKAKAKPQRRDSASSSTRNIPIGERTWTDIEPGEYSFSDYEMSKKLISSSSSRKSTPRRRWSDWILENQRQSSETFLVLSSIIIVPIHQEQSCNSRALQRHSGRSLMDPT